MINFLVHLMINIGLSGVIIGVGYTILRLLILIIDYIKDSKK